MDEAMGCLNCAVKKNALIEINISSGAVTQNMSFVMRIFGAETGKNNFFFVSATVVVVVAEMQKCGVVERVDAVVAGKNAAWEYTIRPRTLWSCPHARHRRRLQA